MSLVGDMQEVSERLDEQSEALKALLEGNRQSRANVEQVLNRPSVCTLEPTRLRLFKQSRRHDPIRIMCRVCCL